MDVNGEKGEPGERGDSLVTIPAGRSVRDSLEGFFGAIEGCLNLLASDSGSPGAATDATDQTASLHEAVRGLRIQASSPFALFVCGEFNSGKSSLINALSGERRCAVGVLPTTPFLEEVRIGDILFIDSPGLNSIIEEHQRASEQYLVRADAVLFVTSVERPLAASEMRFLKVMLEQWRKEVFVVLNKSDSLEFAALSSVEQFLESSLRPLGIGPDRLFSVSTATGAGIEPLRAALVLSLSNDAQVRLKREALRSAALSISGEVLPLLVSRQTALERSAERLGELRERIERRIGDALRIIATPATSVQGLFAMLADKLDDLIDERIGLVAVLRARVLGGKEPFRARVQEVIHELECERRLEDEVRGTVDRLDAYLRGVYDEFQSVLSQSVHDTRELQRGSIPTIEVDLLTRKMNEAIESGLSQLLTAGSLAALSGVGAKISTVTPVEVTATIAMIGLGTFSLRAFPRHRRRVKREVRRAFEEMATTFTASLHEGVEMTLNQIRQECHQWIQPREREVAHHLALVRDCAARLRGYLPDGALESFLVRDAQGRMLE